MKNPQNKDQPKAKPVLRLILLDGSAKMVNATWGVTGKIIRRFIFENLSDELASDRMALFYNNTRIVSDFKLSKLGAPENQPIVIHQRKMLAQEFLPKKKSKSTILDALTGQPGGVLLKMPCGHGISSDSMMSFLRREISSLKKTKLVCPYTQLGVRTCQEEWPFQICEKVGVLTKTEKREFLVGIQRNRELAFSRERSQNATLTSAKQSNRPQPPVSSTPLQSTRLQPPSTSSTLPPSTRSQPVVPSKPPLPNVWSTPLPNSSQTQSHSSQSSSSKLTIKIVPLGCQQRVVTVSPSTTGQQLKQYIYQNCSQSLEPACMSLYYQGTKIGKNTKLSELSIVVGTQLKIKQTKAEISDVVNIIADIQGIDMISLEQGVAKMTCGHSIGRDTMTSLVRSLISSNKFEIRCPYPDDNELPCCAIWCFKDCKKIGVFTREETEEFEKGLSLNWMKQFTKKCPNPQCKQQICKIGLKTNRVVCPVCNYGDFCYLCLNPWKGNEVSCGNEECLFLDNFLTKCPWNRQFKLCSKDKTVQIYNTPQYRACPSCHLVIEHREACKHMTCSHCTTKFCWVCLGVLTNGNWSCGNYNEYCGKVAQAQKLTSN